MQNGFMFEYILCPSFIGLMCVHVDSQTDKIASLVYFQFYRSNMLDGLHTPKFNVMSYCFQWVHFI